MNRRAFLKNVTLAAGLAAAPQFLSSWRDMRAAQDAFPQGSLPGGERHGDMLYRTLGRTGEQVSAIGLGGHHIGRQADTQESIQIIRSAIDHGITFLDNSWDYHDGGSEQRMGQALRDGYRDRVFLMTKIDGRTRASAAKQLDESLQRLQTDHVDLLQVHEVIRLEDPDRIFAEGGSMEAVVAASV